MTHAIETCHSADDPLKPDLHLWRVVDDFAQMSPDQVAIECDGRCVSYRELSRRSCLLAASLVAQGVCPGQIVAQALPSDERAIALLLATLRIGAVYLPISNDVELVRNQLILADASPALLVVDGLTEFNSRSCPNKIMTIGELEADVPDQEFEQKILGEGLAYIIYTSGSTGSPKGVMVSRSNLSYFLAEIVAAITLIPEDRCLLYHSLTFDFSIWEIALCFLHGCTLFVPTASFRAVQLQKLVNDNRLTVVSLVSSALAFLSPDASKTLRVVVTGAEKCSPELAGRWAERCAFYHGYGPTEATVASTLSQFVLGDELTIGRPLLYHTISICDESLLPVDMGQSGEICIGGPAVAEGYLNLPELTAERFVADSQRPGHRLYRTGDMGCLLPDGRVRFVGRVDNQVKIGGYRIELEEIERATLAIEGVTNASANVDFESPVPVVRLLFTSDVANHERVVRDGLRAVLPTYMWPALIRQVPAFPRLDSGKIDRRAHF